MSAAGAADPAAPARRATVHRHASGGERHSVFAADRLPLALSAERQLSAALDRLHYLSQVPARWSLGGDLGPSCIGIARANGSGGQPLGCGS